mmetsp:Transcript_47384/g.157101  ORF Transcript_47384/g.157101 Transcript_47384/m.157101 type:complete len:215 (+) Transcript_47384:432-1076(+)
MSSTPSRNRQWTASGYSARRASPTPRGRLQRLIAPRPGFSTPLRQRRSSGWETSRRRTWPTCAGPTPRRGTSLLISSAESQRWYPRESTSSPRRACATRCGQSLPPATRLPTSSAASLRGACREAGGRTSSPAYLGRSRGRGTQRRSCSTLLQRRPSLACVSTARKILRQPRWRTRLLATQRRSSWTRWQRPWRSGSTSSRLRRLPLWPPPTQR